MKKTNKKDQIKIEIDRLEKVKREIKKCEYLQEMLDILETNSKKNEEFIKSMTRPVLTIGNIHLILSAIFLGIAIIQIFN